MKTKEAIILAAGKGTRLAPLTKDIPKCLVKVNNKTILENTLNILNENGIEKVTIVTGYLEDKIRETIGQRYLNMDINYIYNKKYEITNNIYSLYLALKIQKNSTWIFESDVYLDKGILSNTNYNGITWYVDSKVKNIDGSYIKYDKSNNNLVVEHDIIRNLDLIYNDHCKSIGILHVDKNIIESFINWIEQDITLFGCDIYYDLVLYHNLNKNSIYAKDILGKKWFEIDSIKDLSIAREIFQ